MACYVLYQAGWPVGVFDSYSEIAAFLGVRQETAYFYATDAHKREQSRRRNSRKQAAWIERVTLDECGVA